MDNNAVKHGGGTATSVPECLSFLRAIRSASSDEVIGWYLVPVLHGDGGADLIGDDALTDGSGERAVDQDRVANNICAIFADIVRKFTEAPLADSDVPLVVPVNAKAVALRSIATVLADQCRAIPEVLRPRIHFEVFNFPERLSADFVDDIAILLYPFCGSYLARPEPAVTDFTMFSNCNFQGIAIDLKNKPWPTDKIQPHLEKFAKSAESRRLPAYLHGAANAGVAGAARDAGFAYFDGEGIAA